MLHRLRQINFLNKKVVWLGYFVAIHLTLSAMVLGMLIAIGINPTLLVSVLGAPLWIVVAFTSKNLTDKILED